MESKYWSKIMHERIGRRRALALTGGAAVGASLLAACGGDEEAGGVKGDKSGLITQTVDASKQAKVGGTHKWRQAGEVSTLDAAFAHSPAETPRRHVYNGLLRDLPGYLANAGDEVGPDLAESWEFSPDGLTLTMKLRQGVKWHNRPPVNGRALDMADVLFSWDRMARVGTNRGAIVNSVNPDAPVLSFTAPDSKTVVIKLKQPLAYILSMLSYIVGGSLHMVPKETDTTFNIRADMIGTGSFYLDKYEPSVGFSFKRNPEFYDKSQGPYIDRIEMPFILEYAQGVAQLKAGNLDTYEVRAEDIFAIKREDPQINVYATFNYLNDGPKIGFGYLPGSPFHDQRVRQAVSLALDRDAWIDAIFNVTKFQAEGLPVDKRWHTHVNINQDGWLNPQSKEFGPNAKYFQFNLAEAKKLMSAAGYANGLDVLSTVPAGATYGRDYLKQVEGIEGMLREVGFRPKSNQVDYSSQYIPQIRNARGRFQGWTHKLGPGFAIDTLARLDYEVYSKGGENFYGFDAAGKGDDSGDPQLNALLEKAQGELDRQRRLAIIGDIQRYQAEKMYLVYWPGGATGFQMAWPALRNFNVYTGGGRRAPAHFYWIDETLPPYKKA